MSRCSVCNRFILLVAKVLIIEEHYEILEHAITRWDMAQDPELRYNPKWRRMA